MQTGNQLGLSVLHVRDVVQAAEAAGTTLHAPYAQLPQLQSGCVSAKSLHAGGLVGGHVARSHGLLHHHHSSSLRATVLLVIVVVVVSRLSAASLGLPRQF